MRIVASLGTLVLLATVALTGCGPSASSGSNNANCEYKIGALFPVTGTNAGAGEPDLVGANAAIEDVNSHGGVNGCRLSLIVEDTQSQPSLAVTRFQALVDDGVVAIIGPQSGSETLAVDPLVKKAKIPTCAMASTVGVMQTNDPYSFRCQASDIVGMRAAILFLKQKFNIQKVAIIHTDDAYGTQAAQAATDMAKSGPTQVEITANLPISYSGTDFTSQLVRALAGHPDALLTWIAGSTDSIVLKNAAQLGVHLPMMGGQGFTGPAMLPAGAAANGAYAIDLFDAAHPTPAQQSVVSALQKTQGSTYHVSLFNLLPWDAVHLYAAALKNNPKDVTAGLESIHNLKLAAGTYSFNNPKDHTGLGVDSIIITQIQNGTAVGILRGSDILKK